MSAIQHLSAGRVVELDPASVQVSGRAIILIDPKFAHNVGAALRAASCFGFDQLWFTGARVSMKSARGYRLPREERMKGYRSTAVYQYDRVFDLMPPDVTPVAIEVLEQSESLIPFEHPEQAAYVFGPEDGSLPPGVRALCHRFVGIPTHHCLNLGASVNVTLYDRLTKTDPDARLQTHLAEDRGHFSNR
ncbi:MAG: TrmH family RNA methyltransferase [Pseudomonadota bacterium]